MIKMFLIFSHKLTQEQVKDAIVKFNIDKFVYLPEELQYQWSNVPPIGELDNSYLDKIKDFIISNKSTQNYILIQGELGMSYSLINWCFKMKLIPIYSTTERVHKEEIKEDGSVFRMHKFKHVTYRLYNRE